ncbi:MAG: TIGR01244 family sulfur transferase [Paracoccus sp. (in: a-proteobacteria)]|nr:TIGR01244 family sulfur transferase [Paracoccus sp. (in: a-proteobacteria)]
MDAVQLNADIAVSGQINAEDMARLADQGFVTVINNRPDSEVPPEQQSAAMEQAARAAGLEYHYIPFEPGRVTQDMVDAFAEAIEKIPAFAYCRSGHRTTNLWALSQAGKLSESEIVETAAEAGHDVSGALPLLRQLAGD